MIAMIQRVCALLAQDPVTAAQTAAAIGQIERAGELGLPYLVKPNDSAWTSASVVVAGDGSAPAYVELVPAQPIPVDTLQAGYPDAHPLMRRDWNKPDQMLFNVDIPDAPMTCAIIADLAMQDGAIIASKLTIRRDIRLS